VDEKEAVGIRKESKKKDVPRGDRTYFWAAT
jgi:hypothetical protein